MTTSDFPASAPVTPAPKPNGLQRVFGVLLAPSETFASIARQPDFLAPLALLLIISIASGIVFAQRVDFTAPVRQSMEERGNLSPDQIDRAVRITGTISKIFSYLAPVFTLVFLLIIAAIMLVAFRLFGGEGDFKQSFAVTCYSWMPGLLKSIALTAIIAARGASALDLPTLLRSNLAFLVSVKSNPLLFTLLSKLDVFSIWMLVLFVIGYAFVSKFSKAKSAAIVISLWIIGTLFSLIGPAIQMLRK